MGRRGLDFDRIVVVLMVRSLHLGGRGNMVQVNWPGDGYDGCRMRLSRRSCVWSDGVKDVHTYGLPTINNANMETDGHSISLMFVRDSHTIRTCRDKTML